MSTFLINDITTVPIQRTRTIGIIDVANFVWQYYGTEKPGNVIDVYNHFMDITQEPNERQMQLLQYLASFDELHLVVKFYRHDYEYSFVKRFVLYCPNTLIYLHSVSTAAKSPRKKKEVDDIACLYLRESFIGMGYSPVIITNDKYESFYSIVQNWFEIRSTSYFVIVKDTDPFYFLLNTNFQHLFTYQIVDPTPNLIIFDPLTFEVKIIDNIKPPRKEKLQDLVNKILSH